MPSGNLNLDLARSVNSGALEDDEELSTTLRIGYLHELNPTSSLSVDFSWAEVEDTGSGQDTISSAITATYTRELTRDWGVNVGVRHRFRDDSVTGTARSNEVFMSLRREFLTRF
jgi:predicted porin